MCRQHYNVMYTDGNLVLQKYNVSFNWRSGTAKQYNCVWAANSQLASSLSEQTPPSREQYPHLTSGDSFLLTHFSSVLCKDNTTLNIFICIKYKLTCSDKPLRKIILNQLKSLWGFQNYFKLGILNILF